MKLWNRVKLFANKQRPAGLNGMNDLRDIV